MFMQLLKRYPQERRAHLRNHTDWDEELNPALMEFAQSFARAVVARDPVKMQDQATNIRLLVEVAYAMGHERGLAQAKLTRFLEDDDHKKGTRAK